MLLLKIRNKISGNTLVSRSFISFSPKERGKKGQSSKGTKGQRHKVKIPPLTHNPLPDGAREIKVVSSPQRGEDYDEGGFKKQTGNRIQNIEYRK